MPYLPFSMRWENNLATRIHIAKLPIYNGDKKSFIFLRIQAIAITDGHPSYQVNLGGTVFNKRCCRVFLRTTCFHPESLDVVWRCVPKGDTAFCLWHRSGGQPVVPTAAWWGAYSIIKLFSFLSTLVEAFWVISRFYF